MKARILSCVAASFFAAALGVFGQQGGGQVYRFSLPDRDWALEFGLSDFSPPIEIRGDEEGERALLAWRLKRDKSSPPAGMLLIRMAPARIDGRGAGLPELIAARLKKIGKTARGVKASEYNHLPVTRFSDETSFSRVQPPLGPTTLPSVGAERFRRQEIEAYLIKDDRWIVISLGAESLRADDEKAFYSLLDSVSLVDTSSPQSSFDYYSKGRSLFLAKDYSKAGRALEAALRLEQQNRRLGVAQWRDMVEMMAHVWGAAGDLARAKEVLDYGVGSDPAYPMFHWWLARYYAVNGDLDNTIASLQRAFSRKEELPAPPAVLLAGPVAVGSIDMAGGIPDPMFDPVFKRFQKDERFRKAVKAMKK
jgi:tetratricopeptide (TPR) repeat protein